MKSKEVVAGDSENEFEVDEPEEVGDHSDDEWAPSAVCFVNTCFICFLDKKKYLSFIFFRPKLLVNVDVHLGIHLLKKRRLKPPMRKMKMMKKK